MATTANEAELTKGARITGADRLALGTRLAERYRAGESIRSLAQDTGRSFGFVHGVIKEAGVVLRARGGATRRSTTPTAAAAPAGPTSPGVADAPRTTKAGKGKKSASKKDEGKKDGGKEAGAKVKKEKSAKGKKKGRS